MTVHIKQETITTTTEIIYLRKNDEEAFKKLCWLETVASTLTLLVSGLLFSLGGPMIFILLMRDVVEVTQTPENLGWVSTIAFVIALAGFFVATLILKPVSEYFQEKKDAILYSNGWSGCQRYLVA